MIYVNMCYFVYTPGWADGELFSWHFTHSVCTTFLFSLQIYCQIPQMNANEFPWVLMLNFVIYYITNKGGFYSWRENAEFQKGVLAQERWLSYIALNLYLKESKKSACPEACLAKNLKCFRLRNNFVKALLLMRI